MKKYLAAVFAIVAVLAFGRGAFATPSTHFWAPSTDVQAYGVGHLTSDIYIPVRQDEESGARYGAVTNFGLTIGVLPYKQINLEIGFDHIAGGGDYDAYPMYYNAKLGIPEGAFGEMFPAIAVGGYMFGTNGSGPLATQTDYDIYYAKAAKTIGSLGRVSLGFYAGNDELLLDETGDEEEDGVLIAWERTMSEISDKLWVVIDYMGGDNSFGVLSYGFSWKFAPNVGVIFGYVDQNNDELAVEDTFTVQVDIDFDVFN